MLITGGTVFVSRYAAAYFARRHEVFVLNRNTRPQPEGVTLIEADRHALGNRLKDHHFDAVLDITAYTRADAESLVHALGSFDDYLFISSSAVYPETLPQPFGEDQPCGHNRIWGAYGTDKLEAERWLQAHVPQAYILRPPYLYGPMQNVYREPFVFECADRNLPFYLPGDGSMPLQFFHVEDLCHFMEMLLVQKPKQRIFNVGNAEAVSIRRWVEMCYQTAGKKASFVEVDARHSQRDYFPFHPYAYHLDVSAMLRLLPDLKPLESGLRESYAWYRSHPEECRKKPYFEYIERHIT